MIVMVTKENSHKVMTLLKLVWHFSVSDGGALLSFFPSWTTTEVKTEQHIGLNDLW
jgi:hypothetical protein